LGVIVFECADYPITDPYSITHTLTPIHDQFLQGAHLGAIGDQGLEAIEVTLNDIEREFSVCRIIFCSAWGKGFSVFCESRWVDGDQHQVGVLHQRVDQGSFGELQTDGDWLACESFE